MDLGAILFALLIGVVVKGTVMVLGARLVLKLYRASSAHPPRRPWLLIPKAHLPEIRFLRWSLVLFLLGELTCGIQIYILHGSSYLLGCFHGIVSGLGMGFIALGVYLYLEKTLIRFGGARCLANRICRGCTIQAEQGCKMLLVMLLVATFVTMASLPPFWVSTDAMLADMHDYALPFDSVNIWFDNAVVPWLQSHVAAYDPSGQAYFISYEELVVEYRLLPAVALVIGIVSIVLIRTGREVAGMATMMFAAGMLAYVYLEIAIYGATGDAMLGSLGHEVAELWFLIITAEFLQRAFPPGGESEAEGTAARGVDHVGGAGSR